MSFFKRLKAHILSLILPKIRTTCGVHDPWRVGNIFQLSMNLSSLGNHKKHHNFDDTPSEICECNQGVKDTRHFLFECRRYATHRATLAVTPPPLP